MIPTILIYVYIVICGLLIGSFLNVCIYRIPRNESIVVKRSHCMACETNIKWYDLLPVLSYLCLGGKCRNCKEKISIQYPLIELLNAVGYVWIFIHNGRNMDSILYSLMYSTLLVLSIIDMRTFEIPIELNYFLGVLGILHLAMHLKDWRTYLIGAICVSGGLLLLYIITKGRGIGGGDIKLMAVAGLLLGWQNIILAFFVACILACVCHITQMIMFHKGRQLAFGPYLSIGIMIATVYGNAILHWYFETLG